MNRSQIDHLVITAPSLEPGVEYVRRTLGVNLQVGGEHVRMGTHNCLMKLGEKLYLEVIAIDPNAPHPDRPRWFRLDEPGPSQPIRLTTWIARTENIESAASASPIPLGKIEPMSRNGMHWRITLPADGSLPLNGIAPTLIQWSAGVHPATKLPESGCQLTRLEGFHPEAGKIVGMLDAIGFEGAFHVFEPDSGQKPFLVAHIKTPTGMKRLKCP